MFSPGFPEPLEFEQLRAAWERHDAEVLDRYLVSGVENPVVNAHSVLLRAFLADKLKPGLVNDITPHEIQFSAAATELILLFETHRGEELLVESTQWQRDGNAEGNLAAEWPELPTALPILTNQNHPLYFILESFLSQVSDDFQFDQNHAFAQTWKTIWRNCLENAKADTLPKLTVFEAACGSANDFRWLHEIGLADCIDYTGLDASDQNIQNARARFPQIRFIQGDSAEIPLADATIDFAWCCDLIEHLSIEKMQDTLLDMLRILKPGGELALFCFNLTPGSEHVVQRKELYFWNLLSIPRLVEFAAPFATLEEQILTPAWLSSLCPGHAYYNQEAGVLLFKKRAESSPS